MFSTALAFTDDRDLIAAVATGRVPERGSVAGHTPPSQWREMRPLRSPRFSLFKRVLTWRNSRRSDAVLLPLSPRRPAPPGPGGEQLLPPAKAS
jgi:hypothetical protein